MKFLKIVVTMCALAWGSGATAEYVDATALNCRSSPDAGAPMVAKLSRGQSVEIAETDGAWSRVASPSCWVNSRYLSLDAVSDYSVSSSQSPGNSLYSSSSRRSSLLSSGSISPNPKRSGTRSGKKRKSRSSSRSYSGSSCPCSGSTVCVGPRGGRYCITSGGNKRYGV